MTQVLRNEITETKAPIKITVSYCSAFMRRAFFSRRRDDPRRKRKDRKLHRNCRDRSFATRKFQGILER